MNQNTTTVEVARNGADRTSSAQRIFAPSYRTRRMEDSLMLLVDLPGVRQEDVEVALEGRVLTVRAQSQAFEAPEGYRPASLEFEHGNYERSFTVPREIEAEGVSASVANGVLTLTLKPSRPAKQSIPVIDG